jgi:hypothetical protein
MSAGEARSPGNGRAVADQAAGGLRVVQGDRVLTRFRTQKTGALLAYLAYPLHRGNGKTLIQALVEFASPGCLLLLLDNCEHLLSACAQLAESLLRACPKLCIWATSREGLVIQGEQTYRVPSLSLPDRKRLPPLERLQEYEAVQLFTDRARLSDPSFAVTEASPSGDCPYHVPLLTPAHRRSPPWLGGPFVIATWHPALPSLPASAQDVSSRMESHAEQRGM